MKMKFMCATMFDPIGRLNVNIKRVRAVVHLNDLDANVNGRKMCKQCVQQ